MANRIIFLGTGGGGAGFMSRQTLRTGGKYVELDDFRFVIDPGPGTLVYAAELGLDAESWDGVFISHLHPDHSTDASALLDGMETYFIVAEKHCLKPSKEFYPCITKMHQEKALICKAVKAGDKIKIGKLRIHACKSDHYAPCVGFKIIGSKSIGYTADGNYTPEQSLCLSGCDVLIMNAMIPHGHKSHPKWHLAVDDAITMINAMKQKPRLAVLQHFGYWMIEEGINKQARIIEDETGVQAIAAKDSMEIDLETLKTRILKKD